MSDDIYGGVVAEARSLIEDYGDFTIETVEEPGSGVKALATLGRDGLTILNPSEFDAYRENPLFRRGEAVMGSVDSLIEHVNRFKDADSIVFADDDRRHPSITAVLDYHRAGAEGAPRFGRHRSTFKFPLSEEWTAWNEKDGDVMAMAEFAGFIENRIIDVYALSDGAGDLSEDLQRFIKTLGGDDMVASPTRLMELARGLQVNEDSIVQEAHNLSSGEATVRFNSTHTDASGQALKIPQIFLIVIPVFRNGPLYRIAARLRYRKAGAKILFWYDLWRIDRTFDAAFLESTTRVQTETALPLLLGKPE